VIDPWDGRRALVDAFAAALRGESPVRPPTVVPPHLDGVPWHFACDCGAPSFDITDSATISREGKIVPPRRECPACYRWISGSLNGF
jgi:hypothetical protein